MNKEALLNVAKSLRESPEPDKFTMRRFVYAPDESHPCGTPACALGHYSFRTDLQQAFTPESFGGDGLPCDAREVLQHFEITENQASQLFVAVMRAQRSRRQNISKGSSRPMGCTGSVSGKKLILINVTTATTNEETKHSEVAEAMR